MLPNLDHSLHVGQTDSKPPDAANCILLHRTLAKYVHPCAICHTKKVGGVTNLESKLKGIWAWKSRSCKAVHLIWWFEATLLSSPYQLQTLERDGRHLALPQAQFCTSNTCAVTHWPSSFLLAGTHAHTHRYMHTQTHKLESPHLQVQMYLNTQTHNL